ncbi:hypothetical protein Hanom_Chr07g00623021 [Helianthus anomalus]
MILNPKSFDERDVRLPWFRVERECVCSRVGVCVWFTSYEDQNPSNGYAYSQRGSGPNPHLGRPMVSSASNTAQWPCAVQVGLN